MNEQIRQLLEQAKTESSQWLGSKPATTITYDELEKFAELIVRECVEIADEYDGAGSTIVNRIKQHFGLEEE